MIFASLLVVAVFALVLGAVVFANNPRAFLNRIYVLFSIFAALWMITNAFALESNPGSLAIETRNLVSQTIIIFSTLSALFFLLFVEAFNGLIRRLRVVTAILLFASIVICLFAFTNAYSFVQGDTLVPGAYYGIFSAVIAIFMAVTAYALYFTKSTEKVTQSGLVRQQLTYLQIGYVLAVVPSFIFGGVLAAYSSSDIPALSPVFLIFFLGFAGVAIVKHKLFDVRVFVARSLAYALLISTMAVLYGAIVFVASSEFITSDSELISNIVPFVAAIVVALSFGRIKRFFDKATNRLFYRDAYEPQTLLDELNKVLVANIELDKLLSKSAEVIGGTMKADFCLFGIKEINGAPRRIIGLHNREFHEEDIAAVRSLTPKTKVKIIVTDELEDNEPKLRDTLRANNIALLARLTDTPRSEKEGLGYIIMGAKKSGNPYSAQDIKILEIIADEMVIAIQNALHFEEIQTFAKTLQDKVDEATRNLRKANEKLKALDQTKDDFISMASHQLRTPLTSVKGYVSMVLEGDAGKVSSRQKELLDQAFVSSQRMVYLIADLLNVSRLRTGKFIIEAKPTNLADVIEGEIKQLTETAKGRGLELTYDKPKNFPELMLDDTKIRQVIMNFADNAIYYTPSGGHVKVAVEDKGETIEFTVTDDGLGVPKSEQHHLFNKFYRASNAKKARPDGTGLGLFMAKKVIVAQGGAIIFKTEEGKGSTFGFSFAKKPLLPEHFKGAVAKENTVTQ